MLCLAKRSRGGTKGRDTEERLVEKVITKKVYGACIFLKSPKHVIGLNALNARKAQTR